MSDMEHDYTRPGWGHNCEISRKAGSQDNSFRGYIIGSNISQGDTVLLSMASGKVGVLELDKVKWVGADPGDMYFIEDAHFIGYKEQTPDGEQDPEDSQP